MKEGRTDQRTVDGHGRPRPPRHFGYIPRAIEVLIKKAAVDPKFRQLLLEKRTDAAREIDLPLTTVEANMLNAVPADQLAAIISSTKVARDKRKVFLGWSAVAMLAAVGAVGAVAVHKSTHAWQGIRPGPPPPMPSHMQTPQRAGPDSEQLKTGSNDETTTKTAEAKPLPPQKAGTITGKVDRK